MTALDWRDWDLEFTHDGPVPLTAHELDQLDGAISDGYGYLALPDGSIEVVCVDHGPYVVDDIDDALALIDHHRQMHDQEARS